jgi:hypothetical protein
LMRLHSKMRVKALGLTLTLIKKLNQICTNP